MLTSAQIGAGINIAPNAARILQGLGLCEQLEAIAWEHDKTLLKSYSDGRDLSVINMDRSVTLGFPDMVAHRIDLHDILVLEANKAEVVFHLDSEICDLTYTGDGSPRLIVKNGEKSCDTDVVFIGDGERSTLRSSILDSPIALRDSGDHVYRTVLPLCELETDPELHELGESPHKICWLGPRANALTYHMKRDKLLNIVLTSEHEVTDREDIQLTPVHVDREVLHTYRDWDPRLLKLLRQAGKWTKWTLLELPDVKSWMNGQRNAVLFGDAAHAMSPFLGQGAAMALEDAAVLGVLFSHLGAREDIPAALEGFEALRRPRISKVRSESLKMREVLSLDDGLEQCQRDEQLLSNIACDTNPHYLLNPGLKAQLFAFDVCVDAERWWTGHSNTSTSRSRSTS